MADLSQDEEFDDIKFYQEEIVGDVNRPQLEMSEGN